MAYERFTDRARKVMQYAHQEALRFNHEYIGTEHICSTSPKRKRSSGKRTAKMDAAQNPQRDREYCPKWSRPRHDGAPSANLRQKLPARYAEEAKELDTTYVGTEHIPPGLLRQRRCGTSPANLGSSQKKCAKKCCRCSTRRRTRAKVRVRRR